jgi:hypothetical protein
VWDGLPEGDSKKICNGLILDWAGWQKEGGTPFKNLCTVLEALSPTDEEKIVPGKLTRISLDDPRDIPTLKMPYGQEVPVLHVSAGTKRIIALAYLLIWAWEEHQNASRLLDQETTKQIIFLIDEIESHLHPRWQRCIVKALLNVMESLAKQANVQVIAATHSPLVLASIEPLFNPEVDAWFDLDYVKSNQFRKVVLTRREFELHGEVSNWLTSEAFDLPSARSIYAETLLKEASELIEKPGVYPGKVKEMEIKLSKALNPRDSFLFRWRAICERKGLFK